MLICPWATTIFRLVLVSIVFGIIVGYLGPAPAAIIADMTPKESAGAVMGVYRMSGDIGLLLGPISIGWAASHVGFALAFVMVAACTALVALIGLGARETLTSHESKTKIVLAVEEPARVVSGRQ